jgi:hypothetical protein
MEAIRAAAFLFMGGSDNPPYAKATLFRLRMRGSVLCLAKIALRCNMTVRRRRSLRAGTLPLVISETWLVIWQAASDFMT